MEYSFFGIFTFVLGIIIFESTAGSIVSVNQKCITKTEYSVLMKLWLREDRFQINARMMECVIERTRKD